MRLPNGEQVRGAAVCGVLLALSWGLLRAYPVLWVGVLALVIWWSLVQERAYRASKIDNPSPTEDPEGAGEELLQFRVWEDRPGHSKVERLEGADIRDGEDSDE